jgi:hypothetical protein
MNLRYLQLFLALIFTFSLSEASETKLSFVMESSIPPHVVETLEKAGLMEKYVFTAQINPFYVQGDFNGDGRLDCAILVKQKSSGKIGIAVILSGTRTVKILGAGIPFGNGGDDFSWMDAWYAYPKGTVQLGAEGGTPPRLAGDALMIIKSESASSLVYWTGKQFRWYQQGD